MGLFVQWNCRSLRSNGHWLRCPAFRDACVACIQETFLNPSTHFSFPGMHVYRADRPGARGGGLLTAVRTSLPSYRMQLPPSATDDIEALGVRMNICNTWISVVNVYIPTGIFPTAWFDSLLATLQPPFLILGDFNINILSTHPPIPTQVRTFVDWATAQPLCILNVNTPTRFNHSTLRRGSLLDLTIVSPSLYHRCNFYVHPDPFDSDHHPVFVHLGGTKTSNLTSSAPPKVHWPRVVSDANSLLASDPNCNYTSFADCCQTAIRDNTYSSCNQSTPRPPWWDSTCWRLLGLKRKYLRLARSYCSKDYWHLYKQHSAKLRRHIKTASRKYWDSLCRSSCSSNHIFKLLKRLAKSSTPYGDNILHHQGPVASPAIQAQLFLTAFSQSDPYEPLPYDLSHGDEFLDSPFTLKDLHVALRNTRPTSPGADRISATLLKQLSPQNIQNFLNTLYSTGVVPDSWKLATVVPLHKPGKPSHLVSSFRPIALTSVCAKVFERMLLHRLVHWAGSHNVFHPLHFGFLPFRDCTTALSTFYCDVARARESRSYIAAVCLDIKAAYDSVWIDGLIYKLACRGLRGRMGRWIANFLTDRQIQVRWKANYSQRAPSFRGVPQGCVLSPFLFMLYVSDIFDIVDAHVYILLYADDIIVYAFGPNGERIHKNLQNTLDRLVLWCRAWKLSISVEKCSAINFSRSRDPGPAVKIMGYDLPWSTEVKVLGVWLTRNLSFNYHYTYLRTKAFKRLNYIKAVAGRSRGVSSYHMLRLINASSAAF